MLQVVHPAQWSVWILVIWVESLLDYSCAHCAFVPEITIHFGSISDFQSLAWVTGGWRLVNGMEKCYRLKR